jgi:hypothetical protein
MELMVLILNDEVKCLHVAIQRTHKLVMMGHINYKDHALIKRWQVGKKNAKDKKFKDEKNGVTVESCFCLLLEVVSVFEVLEFITT